MGSAAHNTLVCLAGELQLVANLNFTFGPLVGQFHKLNLAHISQAEVYLDLFLFQCSIILYFAVIY